MNIANPAAITIEEMAMRLQPSYPDATVKKPWIGGKYVHISQGNAKLFVRQRKNKFITDFNPPPMWTVMGMLISAFVISLILTLLIGQQVYFAIGAVPVIIGVLGVKAIYKSKNKEMLGQFDRNVQYATTNNSSDSTIF